MRKVPQVMTVMTPFPYSIDAGEPLSAAQQMMAEHAIHHLPVKEHGELVGVITDRDISRALSARHRVEPEGGLRVRDVAVLEAYVVELTERLDCVLLRMAETHIGSALVVKDGRLAGIFTTSDACRAYGKYIRSQFPISPGGNDAA